jgi:hypothetical protein
MSSAADAEEEEMSTERWATHDEDRDYEMKRNHRMRRIVGISEIKADDDHATVVPSARWPSAGA